MKIKNVKFSYVDSTYKLGPYVDFIDEIDVPSLDYNSIADVLQNEHPEFEQISIMSFSKL